MITTEWFRTFNNIDFMMFTVILNECIWKWTMFHIVIDWTGIWFGLPLTKGFLDGAVVKNTLANAGNAGSIPGLGRSTGEGNAKPLQYSCLGNPMDRGAWQATVYGVEKSWTRPASDGAGICDQSPSPQSCWHQMLWGHVKEVQLHWLLWSPGNTVSDEDLEKSLGLKR